METKERQREQGNTKRIRHWFQPVFFVVLLYAMAMGISGKTERAVAPPTWDPLGYMQKGHSVWALISEGKWGEILNAQPLLRPPGCVPFCYPFGYTDDFRSFLFWSTFSPILIWALALWQASRANIRTAIDRWCSFLVAVGLLSLPMFYHFEQNIDLALTIGDRWGLQDCLLAALAALATCAVVGGARNRSLTLTWAGWLLSAYCLLIKPSGSLIMISIGGIWFVEVLSGYLPKSAAAGGTRSGRIYFWTSLISCVVIYAVVAAGCMNSRYLSRENLDMAMTAQKIFLSLGADQMWISTVAPMIRPVLGWFWFPIFFFLLVGGIFHAATKIVRGQIEGAYLRVIASLCLILTAGVWWLRIAGPEARYFFPFLLMPLIWLLPDALSLLQRVKPAIRLVFCAITALPTGVLLVLLWSPFPSTAIQRALGYNLSSGGYAEEVSLAKSLLRESAEEGYPLKLYAPVGIRVGVVHAVGFLEAVSSGKASKLEWINPLDWVRTPGFRLSDITGVDYVLFEKRNVEWAKNPAKIDTFNREVEAFEYWIGNLPGDQGATKIKDGPLQMIQINDPEKLVASFRQYATRFEWSPAFLSNNPELFSNSQKDGGQSGHAEMPQPSREIEDPYAGHLDVVDRNQITGWARDISRPGERMNVNLYDGNAWIAQVKADQFRQDLLEAKFGDGRYCFKIPLPKKLRDGKVHVIHAILADTDFELANSPVVYSSSRRSQ